jgi:hypothetical protein
LGRSVAPWYMAIVMTDVLDIFHHLTLKKSTTLKIFFGVIMSKISVTINKS